MESAALSFANLHNHGELFSNILCARREAFDLHNQRDSPQTMGMEYDQYDTPQSRWLAVHEAGRVYAGVRLTPTQARCGIYSYMIRDAQNGLLNSVPHDLLYNSAPVDEGTWEVTRGFIAPNLPAALQKKVRLKLVHEMLRTSRIEGIGRMIALLPTNWNRWAAYCKLEMNAAGCTVDMGGVEYRAVSIDLRTQLH